MRALAQSEKHSRVGAYREQKQLQHTNVRRQQIYIFYLCRGQVGQSGISNVWPWKSPTYRSNRPGGGLIVNFCLDATRIKRRTACTMLDMFLTPS